MLNIMVLLVFAVGPEAPPSRSDGVEDRNETLLYTRPGRCSSLLGDTLRLESIWRELSMWMMTHRNRTRANSRVKRRHTGYIKQGVFKINPPL